MKKIVDNYLYNRAGFKAYDLFQSPLPPIVFDVIGPPGVGKSFFIQALISGGVIKYRPHRFTKDLRLCSARSRLLSLLALNRDDLEVLRRKSTKLLYDLNIMSSTSRLIVDEGVCHHFSKELIQLSRISKADFLTIMRGRGVINLTAPPDVIATRIAHRHRKTGKILKYHEGKTEYELQELNSAALRQRDELCALMRAVGCPTISIDVSDSKFTRSWLRVFEDEIRDAKLDIRAYDL